ncbi:J domain-containing protein [Gracilinema caldarium]|uniref:Heat shock protein DnaJ domain protein n=1 Tax=Gracilinema caldarium (strain ATCC 51460 / DSM 7334 / H1) TaxID=744872 RepID=F8EZ60_GRAC1|nr:J domain-containing protein [Gracilinema caldarium]AEJ19652.1 heat shock protein DnaJ domain protein [Gracilinema caldarium DSM 7334]
MDKFFDRLGEVLKTFLDEDSDRLFRTRQTRRPFSDPDLDAAYDELEAFLNSGKIDNKNNHAWADYQRGTDDFHSQGSDKQSSRFKQGPAIPESLRKDFEELGLPFGASEEACKAAYKRLLKIHHPDRHAGHPGNMKKATEKSARINAAYQRIETWRQTGKVD